MIAASITSTLSLAYILFLARAIICTLRQRQPRPKLLRSYSPRSYKLTALVGAVPLAFIYHRALSTNVALSGDWVYLGPSKSLANAWWTPSLWNYKTLGFPNLLGIPTFPLYTIEALLVRLGTPLGLAERLLFMLPVPFLAYYGIIALLRVLNVTPILSVFMGLFYSSNTFFLDWYSGGWLTILLGYALLPWITATLLRAYNERLSWPRLLALGLMLNIAVAGDPRQAVEFTYAGAIVILAIIAAGWRPQARPRLLAAFACLAALTIIYQADWLLPVLEGARPSLAAGYTSSNALTEFSYMHLANATTGFDLWWPHMKYFVQETPTPLWAYVIPSLALVGLWKGIGDLVVTAAAAVYGFFSILVAGSNAPFGWAATFAFQHLPGDNLFRYPALFEEPVLLALTILAACGAETLATAHRRKARHAFRSQPTLSIARPSTAWVTCSVLGIYVGAVTFPATLGSLGHMLTPIKMPTAAQVVQSQLDLLPPGNVLWVPDVPETANQGIFTGATLHPPVSALSLLEQLTPGAVYSQGPLAWLTQPAWVISEAQGLHIRYVVDATHWRAVASGPALLSAEDAVTASLRSALGPPLLTTSAFTLYKGPGTGLVTAHTLRPSPPQRLSTSTQVRLPLAVPSERGFFLRIYRRALQLKIISRGEATWLNLVHLTRTSASRVRFGLGADMHFYPTPALLGTIGRLVGAAQLGQTPILVRAQATGGTPALPQNTTPPTASVRLSPNSLPPITSRDTSRAIALPPGTHRAHNVLTYILDGWRSVGDGDNYRHLSLRAAGIAMWRENSSLTLAVKTGAASTTMPWSPWGWSAYYLLALRYRGTRGAIPNVSIFALHDMRLIASVYLPQAGLRWHTSSRLLYLPPIAGGYLLSLAALPTAQGQQSYLQVTQAQLSQVIATTTGHARRSAAPSPALQLTPWGPDAFSLRLPPTTTPLTIDFWQTFAPGWTLQLSNHTVVHRLASTWANQFVVPPHRQALTAKMFYGPNQTMLIGLHLADVAYLLTSLLLLASWLRRRTWRPNSHLEPH